MSSLKVMLQKYEFAVNKAASRFPERKGIKAKRLYTPNDLKDWDYEEKLGVSGSYPYTRGIQVCHIPRMLLDYAPVFRYDNF